MRTTATELGLYRRDASNIEGSAGVVCFPTSTDEVRAVVAARAAELEALHTAVQAHPPAVLGPRLCSLLEGMGLHALKQLYPDMDLRTARHMLDAAAASTG